MWIKDVNISSLFTVYEFPTNWKQRNNKITANRAFTGRRIKSQFKTVN